MEEEIFFICPYCGERISFLVNKRVGEIIQIEDCEVCCNQIEVEVEFDDSLQLINLKPIKAY